MQQKAAIRILKTCVCSIMHCKWMQQKPAIRKRILKSCVTAALGIPNGCSSRSLATGAIMQIILSDSIMYCNEIAFWPINYHLKHIIL